MGEFKKKQCVILPREEELQEMESDSSHYDELFIELNRTILTVEKHLIFYREAKLFFLP